MAHSDFHLYSILFYSILDGEILGIIILLKVHNSFHSSSIAFYPVFGEICSKAPLVNVSFLILDELIGCFGWHSDVLSHNESIYY